MEPNILGYFLAAAGCELSEIINATPSMTLTHRQRGLSLVIDKVWLTYFT